MGYIALGKNCVFYTLIHYKNTFLNFWAGFLSHFATSCYIVTWAPQDEIKSFNISKLHFNMVMISKNVKSFK